MLRARSLAIAAMVAVVASTCSTSSSTTSNTPVTSAPSPTPSRTSSPEVSHWTEVWSADVVSRSFLVATVETCHGTHRDPTCDLHLSASQDAGHTWYDISPPQVNSDLSTVDFIDVSHGWVDATDCAGGHGTLLRTVDGGATWGASKGVYHSCNAGADAVPSFQDAEHGWLLHNEPTGASSELFYSEDGGKIWHPTHNPQPMELALAAGFTAPDVGWVSGWAHGEPALFRSNLTGTTWSEVPLPLPDIPSAGDAFAGVPTAFGETLIEPVQFWSHGHLSVVFDRSDDGGSTWRLARIVRLAQRVHEPRGPFAPGWVGVGSPETFFVSAGHGVVRSDASGRTRLGTQPGRIAAQGLAGNVVWATPDDHESLLRVLTHQTEVVSPWPPSAHSVTKSAQPIGDVPPGSSALLGGTDGSLYLISQDERTVFRMQPGPGNLVANVGLGRTYEIAAAEAGGYVWVMQATDQGHGRLLRLSAASLGVLGKKSVTRPANGLAAVGTRVWFGSGQELTAVDATSGATVSSVPLDGHVKLIAGDATTGRLYVVLDGPVRGNQLPMLEVDAYSGTVLARTYVGYADLGVTGLVPTPDGVWVGEPSGMMGVLHFYSSDGLVAAPGYPDGRDGGGQLYGSNAIMGLYASGYLFVGYPGGLMTCVDAETGQRLGLVGAPHQGMRLPIVNVGSRTVTVVGRTLYSIDPQVACQ